MLQTAEVPGQRHRPRSAPAHWSARSTSGLGPRPRWSASCPPRSACCAAAALHEDAERARGHATEVMSADGAARGARHLLHLDRPAALVRPRRPGRPTRLLVHGDRPVREVYWRGAMADARRRIARAYAVTKEAIGEDGPAVILRDTGRWLERFHPHSAVELDYGGLVALIADDELLEDTSAQDVQAILAAMEAGDADELNARYEKVREFWARLAAKERLQLTAVRRWACAGRRAVRPPRRCPAGSAPRSPR